MENRKLLAFANGRRVGTLLDTNGIWSFAYEEDWVNLDRAFPLSPNIPLTVKPLVDGSSARPVQWFFDNLLPEEAMRTAIAREARVDASDAWGLLSFFGRETAGALTLLGEDDAEPAGGRQFLSLEELEARIQAMPQQALTARSPKRMSAAGAQQKLLLIMVDQSSDRTLFEPVGSEPSMHLLKPDMRSAGYPHSAINEFFCMQLALKMRLNVPPTHFLRAPSACYLIDRFDRDSSTHPAARLHTLDATQLLGFAHTFKYHEANVDSLRRCVELTSTKAATRLALFKWSVFNVLIGNADAHLKNVFFFSTDRGYSLAPFYDMVSTVVYNNVTYQEAGERWPHCELTIPLGTAKTCNDVTRDDILVFAEQLGLKRPGAERELDGFLAGLDDKVREVRDLVNRIAVPNGGEARLLTAIAVKPLREMSKKLRSS
jgi:serine/threonine-protein kinase HipA